MKDHPIVHFEIGSHDGEKTSEFFAELFGWKIAGDDAGRIINTGGEGVSMVIFPGSLPSGGPM